MTPTYIYSASLVRVVDGDTFILDVDLGLKVHVVVPIRLRGFYAPERRTAAGARAATIAAELLADGPLVVRTHKDQQSFSRWIADVWVGGRHVADLMRDAGVLEGGAGL